MYRGRGRGLEDLQRMRDMRTARKKHGRWNQLRRLMQRRKAMQARQRPQQPRVPRPPMGKGQYASPMAGALAQRAAQMQRQRDEQERTGQRTFGGAGIMAGEMDYRPDFQQPGVPSPSPRQPIRPPNQQGYGGIATGMASALQQMKTPEQRRAQAQAIGGGMKDLMNSGGADLPPQDGNPYSPTGGQGFNLANMIRRRRNKWS